MPRELRECVLCEWRCRVDRTAGELGTCMLGTPQVASRTLHPAPPSSYTIFMAGCNFRCLHCQNWDIAHWPVTHAPIDGACDPGVLAHEALRAIASPAGRVIGADRIFFSGGEATCSLPFVEEVVWHARKLDPHTRVNFDTNGFMTEDSLRRVLSWTTSVTFDLRATDDEVHRAMVGAPAAPVLRNARIMAEHEEKLWEFRILVVPAINQDQLEPLSRFVANLGRDLPVCFLAFRPNYVLEEHSGASYSLMEKAVSIARDCGLRNVHWAGHAGLPGGPHQLTSKALPRYASMPARLAGSYAQRAGCATVPRDCGNCSHMLTCKLKAYKPRRRT
jgi:pyruvate formate lyase activating enzyme